VDIDAGDSLRPEKSSMSSPVDLTIAEASTAIAKGELSPTELTAACLERADELEPVLKTFVTLDADGAIAQARELTEALAGGAPRSPLHGIPIGIKDLIDVVGLPTTAGSRILAANVASADAPVVARLRLAGTVIMGKTNTQEFAYGVVTAPTRNPWDTTRIPGGSSGGSAAAVAGAICPGALGTDTAGSIRIPSALCGVSGLRPRQENVPLDGIVPLAPSLDACGPIARDVADLILIWNALHPAGAGPSHPERELRVASPERLDAILDTDSEVATAFETAVAKLSERGARVTPCELPSFSEWDFPRSVPLMVEALIVHKDAGWYPQRTEDYTPETLASLGYAEKLPATVLLESQRKVVELVDRWRAALAGNDVLALPTTPYPAQTIEEATVSDGKHRTPVVRNFTRTCGPVNCCDYAAVSVPCGFTSEGLPIGIQFIARDEETALRAGAEYQAITNWHGRRPPLG
jgi:aspartyl-tRNA(Asn)/glutamyl-tRNA(Gln) amidotransferase subunit A